MVDFDLGGGVENVPGCCRTLAHPRKPSGNAVWCLTCRFGIGAGIAWLGEASEAQVINIHLSALTMAI